MWEKFSPFSRRFHMFYDLSAERFIFVYWIILIEYTIVLLFQSYTWKTILRIVAQIAVPIKRIIITYGTKTWKARSVTRITFILLLAFKSWFKYIVAILYSRCLVAVFDIFSVRYIKAFYCKFRIIYHVSEYIFCVSQYQILSDKLTRKFLKKLCYILTIWGNLWLNFIFLISVLLGTVFLVHYVIVFPYQSIAEHTILTVFHILAKETMRAIVAEKAVFEWIWVNAILRLVAQFAIFQAIAIETISRIEYPSRIIYIFRVSHIYR